MAAAGPARGRTRYDGEGWQQERGRGGGERAREWGATFPLRKAARLARTRDPFPSRCPPRSPALPLRAGVRRGAGPRGGRRGARARAEQGSGPGRMRRGGRGGAAVEAVGRYGRRLVRAAAWA